MSYLDLHLHGRVLLRLRAQFLPDFLEGSFPDPLPLPLIIAVACLDMLALHPLFSFLPRPNLQIQRLICIC